MSCGTGALFFQIIKISKSYLCLWEFFTLRIWGVSRNLQFWELVVHFLCNFWSWDAIMWPGVTTPSPQKLVICRSRHFVESVFCSARGMAATSVFQRWAVTKIYLYHLVPGVTIVCTSCSDWILCCVHWTRSVVWILGVLDYVAFSLALLGFSVSCLICFNNFLFSFNKVRVSFFCL